MTPVTIGDQKFIKDPDNGWIDAKTKQPAEKGLIKLLDTVVIDEPIQKKLRIKIDKNVEPVFINGQKFVYDVNQGWLDDKTKTPAPPSLQRTLNAAVPRPMEDETYAADVTASMGIAGEAAKQKTKVKTKKEAKTGGGVLVKNRNTDINKPLVAMIDQLASIDGYLKQQLQNKELISAKELAQAKENAIEGKDTEPAEQPVPDAERENKGNLLGAVALAGLIALQFDPVKETIKSLADFGKNAISFVVDTAKTINSAFDWLLDTKSKGTQPASDIGPKTFSDQDYLKKPAAFSTYTNPKSSTTPTTPRPTLLSADPKVREQALTQKSTPEGQQLSTPAKPASPGWSLRAPQKPVARPLPQTPKQKPVAKQEPTPDKKLSKDLGAFWSKSLKENKQEQNKIPKNDIVALGRYLQNQEGLRITGHSAFGGQEPGQHSSNSRHYKDMAIDVNLGTGLVEADDPAAGPRFDALQAQLEAAGYNVIWRKAGHYNHMHISVGGPEGIAGGESPLAATVDAIENAFEISKKLFGKAGAALIGADNYTRQELTTPASKLGPIAKSYALEKTASMVDSRTPTPPPRPQVPKPNINPNKNSPVIQTPATTNDMSSVNYYLERFGFMPAKSEMTLV